MTEKRMKEGREWRKNKGRVLVKKIEKKEEVEGTINGKKREEEGRVRGK